MYSKHLEELMEAILADGVITDQERRVLRKRAEAEGVDYDELEVILEGRLAKMKAESKHPPVAPPPMPLSNSASTSQKNSYGTLHKCPNCGDPVDAARAVCSACGYVFRNIDAVSSVKRFSEEIKAIQRPRSGLKGILEDVLDDRDGRVESLIINFPVPNTKEDLVEFIMFTYSKVKVDDNYSDSYKTKYEECIAKAKFYFPDDPQLQPLFQQYESYKKNWWKRMNKRKRAGILSITGFVSLILFGLLLALIGIAFS